jgi:2-haloacid dehalogenase
MLDFSRFRVLTFDCYGTLIDWERGIARVLQRWARRHRLSLRDEELLEAFASSEARQEQQVEFQLYPDVLRAVHREIGKQFGRPVSNEDADALAESVGEWPPFADTTEALRRLQRRYRLVVVSNVDHASFARTQQQLGIVFDAVVTAEAVRAYKPDRRMFERALERAAELGAATDQVLHVAQSLYHDIVPAKALGLATVWVNRRAGKPGWGATRPPDRSISPDLEVHSLAELAERAT